MLDLAEVPALHGSGPLLGCSPPSVLDLDKLRPSRNLAVDVGVNLGLIARSVKTLIALHVAEERSVVSAAAGTGNASSGGGVEGGVFAVERRVS